MKGVIICLFITLLEMLIVSIPELLPISVIVKHYSELYLTAFSVGLSVVLFPNIIAYYL